MYKNIIAVMILLIIVCLSIFLLFARLKPQIAGCGDRICQPIERQRGVCPEDCKPALIDKTCSEQAGTICSSSETCSGSWLEGRSRPPARAVIDAPSSEDSLPGSGHLAYHLTSFGAGSPWLLHAEEPRSTRALLPLFQTRHLLSCGQRGDMRCKKKRSTYSLGPRTRHPCPGNQRGWVQGCIS